MFDDAQRAFPGILTISDDALLIPPGARPLTRIIARSFDAYDLSKTGHSSAI
jgi:oxygen-independent coproporphyrinogen III oxidase